MSDKQKNKTPSAMTEDQVRSGGFGANDSSFLLRSAVQESSFCGTVGNF